MKLLMCKNCHDVISLIMKERKCLCGTVSGKYVDELNAVYTGGLFAIPLGIHNNSLMAATIEQPEEGMGKDFKAFVIPKICPTFRMVDKI